MKSKLFKILFSGLLFVPLLLVGCDDTSDTSTSSSDTYSISNPYDEDVIAFHYNRKDSSYETWALWLWENNGGEGAEYAFSGVDSFGAYGIYKLSTWTDPITNGLGFIVKSAGSWGAKDVSDDRIVNFSKFVKTEDGVYNVFLKSGDKGIYTSSDLTYANSIDTAAFTSTTTIDFVTTNKVKSYSLYENDVIIGGETFETPKSSWTATLSDDKKADFNNSYKVECVFEDGKTLSSNVSLRNLYSTSEFSNQYNYDGELGAIYSESETTFKVWSPVASKIVLNVYNSGTPVSVSATKGDDTLTSYNMTKGDNGVFSSTVSGDLAGKYYTYKVSNGNYPNGKEIVDPYAKGAGVNGLRGMIVDFSKTNPTDWDSVEPLQIDRKALTVYETHVADITSSRTWSSLATNSSLAKTFKGAYLSGTTYSKDGVTVTTGFDHIKELGVNAVQLLPIFDQANDEINKSFNWGYNPLNYNVLDGSYSSDPYDGYARIKEFKQLVQAYNEAGINIIMDVVYNHVNGLNGSNFDVLMPGYYFRYDASGNPSNGSGCGNETASEMYMFRKFMVDSTSFWASEYKLGGFRFDLMGLHDVTTMNRLVNRLKQINPSICVYGEPWTGGTTPLPESEQAKQSKLKDFQGYGAFNDKMRDELIKGGLAASSEKGWITSTSGYAINSALTGGIRGITYITPAVSDPNKAVSYVTCHDNYTLYDRIKAAGITDEATVKKMAMLANSVVLTSQGTSFMLAGEEFLRTKQGNSNSYNASYEVNELDYSLKIKNIDMFNNYKKLIAFKQNVDGMHLNTVTSLTISSSLGNRISYDITDTENNLTYKVIHTNGYSENTLGNVNLDGYTLYLDTLNRSDLTLSSSTSLKSFETIIAYKSL